MNSTSQSQYKFPRQNTYPAGILLQLLNGKKITNAEMMALLDCPHAGAVMSKIRQHYNWEKFLNQGWKSTISGMGETTQELEYWFDPMEIMQLKANDPRVEKFLKANRKN